VSPRIHRGFGLGLVFPVIEGKTKQQTMDNDQHVLQKMGMCRDVLCGSRVAIFRPSNAPMLRNPMGFMEMIQKHSPRTTGLTCRFRGMGSTY
jgi:hypothetical protein